MILAPLIHKAKFWPSDYIIGDEGQDTNAARRAAMLAMLRPRTGRLVVVGDDRQAIYGFTGADSDAMSIIQKQMNSIVLPLNVTFRCPKAVVTMAQTFVPDFTAADSAPEGVVRTITHQLLNEDGSNMKYWFEMEEVGYGDVVLCRNTKPLIEEAFAMLRAGIGCVVEGRDIGKGLITLATRWKRMKSLAALTDKLEDYKTRQMQKWLAKGKEERAAQIEDRVDTLVCLIKKVQADGSDGVNDLISFINSLFGDSDDKTAPKVVRLSTIHKSKGREWDRVFMLGRNLYCPSKYARKPWQQLQEQNLEYVMITRSKRELIDIVMGG